MPLPQHPQLAGVIPEPLAQQLHAGIPQSCVEGQVQLLQVWAGAQHCSEVLAAGAGHAGVPQPAGESLIGAGPPMPHTIAVAIPSPLSVGQRDKASLQDIVGHIPSPLLPQPGMCPQGPARDTAFPVPLTVGCAVGSQAAAARRRAAARRCHPVLHRPAPGRPGWGEWLAASPGPCSHPLSIHTTAA